MSRKAAMEYISGRREGPAVIRPGEPSSFINRKKAKPAPKRGKRCIACGMERSLAGKCDCNE